MCDPITIAGIATTGASAAANYASSNDVASARSRVLQQERQRQADLDAQAGKLNTQSQDLYQDFGAKQAAAAQTLGDLFKAPAAAGATGGAPALMPPSASGVTNANDAVQVGKATAYGNQQGAALGNLRAFGDVMGTAGRTQAQDASLIGQINNFKRGSAGVTPLELDDASHAGDQMKFFGDLLGTVGKVGLMKGLSAGPKLPMQLPGAAAITNSGATVRPPSFGPGDFNPFTIY